MSDFFADDHFFLARKAKTLRQRSRVMECIRDYFIRRDFLDVETPLRIPAPAPEEHIEAIGSENWFLQTSPELCMKRLLAAGYPRLFQISKCFRKSERGVQHLPEFTMLEWYVAGFDYQALMDQCEDLIRFVAGQLGTEKWTRHGKDIALAADFERITVADAFAKYASVAVDEALAQNQFDELLVNDIEPRLGMEKPTFLYDYPASLAALAKLKDGNPSVCERFELYIGGLEIVNGFSELTDAAEQRHRFDEALKKRAAKGWSPYDMPEKFLQSLDALPPCAGAALGVDRLVMLCTGADRIDDVVAFTPEDL